MTAQRHCIERWLVLDAPVWRALHADADGGLPGEPPGLLALRLAHGLVEPLARPALGRRLAALSAAGFQSVLVLAEQVEPELLACLRGPAATGMQIVVHDWYASPGDVIATLNAPDAALAARLRQRSPPVPLAIWPPVPPATDGMAFRRRYRAALAAWEREARDEHGQVFTELYGAAIDWPALLPEVRDDALLPAAAGEAGFFEWLRAQALPAGGGADLPREAFEQLAQAGSADGTTRPLNWSYRIDGGGKMALRIDLPSRAGANVELLAALGPQTKTPAAFALVDSGEVIVSVAAPQWQPSGSAQAPWVSVHSFPDEFGELRARFQALSLQPELRVMPATDAPP